MATTKKASAKSKPKAPVKDTRPGPADSKARAAQTRASKKTDGTREPDPNVTTADDPKDVPTPSEPPAVAPGAEESTTPAPVAKAHGARGQQSKRKGSSALPDGHSLSLQSGEAIAVEERAVRCPDCGAGAVVQQHGPGCTQVERPIAHVASGEQPKETRS